jgi:hypothetical protein
MSSAAIPLYVPEHINLETSDRCTRRCAFCPTQRDRDKSGPVRFIDDAVVAGVVDDLARVAWHFRGGPPPPPSSLALAPTLLGASDRRPLLKISLQWIDEPLVNPALEQRAQQLRAALPFARLLLQTNGDLLTAARADALRSNFDAIVVNAYSRSAHQRLLGLGLDVVWAPRPRGAPAQPPPHQSPGRLKRPLSVDEDRRREAVWHINEKFHDDAWVWTSRHQPRNARCTHLFTEVAIGHDGAVYICCRDSEKAHPVGTIGADGLLAAYNSAAATTLRQHMERGRRDRIAMCAGCDGRFQSPITPVQVATRPGPQRRSPGLPYGRYPYWAARALAAARGDVCLPGILDRRYEYLAGVTPRLAARLKREIEGQCGAALRGVFVVGGRVIPRGHLRLLDPAVFRDGGDGGDGTLEVAHKGLLREHGPDARFSSDVDVKVFVAAGAFDDEQRGRMERALGRGLGRGLGIPLSGHHDDAILRLIEVDPACVGDDAFHAYNAARLQHLGKGPLSLAYAQRLVLDNDPRASVMSCLVDVADADAEVVAFADHAAIDDVDVDVGVNDGAGLVGVVGEGDRALVVHQLIGALLDAPTLLPRGPLTPTARFAISAAATLRRALAQTPWPTGKSVGRSGPLRVLP